MKVLQVITTLKTGGAERLLADSLFYYQAKGVALDVLVLDNSKTFFWKKIESISKGSIVGLTSKSIYNPFLIFNIIPHLRKYDILHVHLFPTLYWVVIAKLLSFSKVKLIYTEHSTSNRRRNLFFFQVVDRLLYRKIDKIISISDSVQHNLKEHLNLSSSMFQVISNGIDLNAFISPKSYDKSNFFSKEDVVLIQVGGFKDSKDQSTVIRALEYLPKKVKLLLVGDGVKMFVNQNLVKDLGLIHRVLFLGSRTDIPELLKMSDISVVSSNWEGFGLAAVEGMAAHKPVIASNVDGLRQIVEGAGIIFEKGNEKELAKYIDKLISNPNFYKEIVRKCKKRADSFSIDSMVDKYIGVYKTLLK